MSVEIDNLVARLASLGRLRIYGGPNHPTDPHPEVADEIAEFMRTHPHMARDPDYLRLLETYAGVFVSRAADWFSLNIYGFDPDEWPYLPRKEEVMTDAPGYDSFANIHYKLAPELPGEEPLVFAFSVAEPGVFRCVAEGPYEWFCDTFIRWLRRVVDENGFKGGVPQPDPR